MIKINDQIDACRLYFFFEIQTFLIVTISYNSYKQLSMLR